MQIKKIKSAIKNSRNAKIIISNEDKKMKKLVKLAQKKRQKTIKQYNKINKIKRIKKPKKIQKLVDIESLYNRADKKTQLAMRQLLEKEIVRKRFIKRLLEDDKIVKMISCASNDIFDIIKPKLSKYMSNIKRYLSKKYINKNIDVNVDYLCILKVKTLLDLINDNIDQYLLKRFDKEKKISTFDLSHVLSIDDCIPSDKKIVMPELSDPKDISFDDSIKEDPSLDGYGADIFGKTELFDNIRRIKDK